VQVFEPPHSAETKAALLMLRAMGWKLQYGWHVTHDDWHNKEDREHLNEFFDCNMYRAIPPGEKVNGL
jgi:hypothetical protein